MYAYAIVLYSILHNIYMLYIIYPCIYHIVHTYIIISYVCIHTSHVSAHTVSPSPTYHSIVTVRNGEGGLMHAVKINFDLSSSGRENEMVPHVTS